MPRNFTGDERTAIAAGHYNAYATLEVMDSEGTWRDVSTDVVLGSDFLNAVTLETDVDKNCWRMQAEIGRDALGVSLAPLMEASPANLDSDDEYAPFLDPSRRWRVTTAIVLHGATVLSGNWHPLCEGTYDIIDVNSPKPTISLVGRDLGASLLDLYVEGKFRYGDNDTPVPMEDVIQKMLDDHLGPGEITLYTPTSPSFVLKQFEIGDMSLMEMVNKVAAKASMVCRYRYDDADDFLLTLYAPVRDAEPGDEDWTLGPSEYLEVPQARLDLNGVRNQIKLIYREAASPTLEEVDITQEDTASVERFGGPHGIFRRMIIDLADEPHFPMTSVQAAALVQSMLSDIAFPPFMHQYEAPGFWIVQLGDYGKFVANGVHYDNDQYGGVDYIRHTIANGNLRTVIGVGGQPKGRYRQWLANASALRGTRELRIANFRETARDEDVVTFGWYVRGQAEELWLFLNTEAQPVPSDPWPSLTDVPFARFTPDTIETDVAIPGDGEITYGILLPVGPNATMGKPWTFTVQRVGAREIPQGWGAFDNAGNSTFGTDGAAWTASYKYKTSTVGFPTEADVLATGTVVNGRQVSVSGPSAVPLASSAFATFVPFSENSAGGFQGTSMRIQITRHDATATKTVLFSAGSVNIEQPTTDEPGIAYLVKENGIVRVQRSGTITEPHALRLTADLQVPQGCIATSISFDVYKDASTGGTDTVLPSLREIASDGTVTTIASPSAPGAVGWQTLTASFSDSTTGARYLIYGQFNVDLDDTVDDNHLRWGRHSITYSMPSQANGL